MPVQFVCSACQQALKVGSRKAGCRVKCPKCQASILVPNPKEAADSQGVIQPVRPADGQTVLLDGLAIYDDVPAIIDRGAARSAATSRDLAVDRRLVSISRRVLYAQAALIVVVATVAFGLGYRIGRGPLTPGEPKAPLPPVEIEAAIAYRTDRGELAPDVGAVVIAIPAGSLPPGNSRFDAAGLRPQDPPPIEGHHMIRAIEGIGGLYQRVTAGKPNLLVRPGKYHVLVISNRTVRPAAAQPTQADLTLLGRYFELPTSLIGANKYALALKTWPNDGPLAVNFGQSGK